MFYDKVKALCDKQGISITELTSQLKLGTSAPTGWKNGAVPRAGTIKAIADYFDVSVTYFNDGNIIAINSNYIAQGANATINDGKKCRRDVSDIAAEFEGIAKLFNMGVITQSEFDAKKRELRRELGYDD